MPKIDPSEAGSIGDRRIIDMYNALDDVRDYLKDIADSNREILKRLSESTSHSTPSIQPRKPNR